GQDNDVLVDTANAIIARTSRPIGYLHIPVIPEHAPKDYQCFTRLELPAKTKLYLGLLNLADGLEGAKRRIAMASAVIPDFGISMFCGLGRPSTALARGPSSHSVRWAAPRSGGLKSLRRSDEERRIQRRG